MSHLVWLGGQWEMGLYFPTLAKARGRPLPLSSLSRPFAPVQAEMPWSSSLLPGGVCRAELSTSQVGWSSLSVSTAKEETWAQRSGSQQKQLQAAETLSEREEIPET